MKPLLLLLSILAISPSSLAQKAYLYAEVDPFWKTNSSEFWKDTRGYGKKIPQDMALRIPEMYKEINNQLGLESYKMLRQATLFKELERTSNPTSLFLGKDEVFIDLRTNIRQTNEKYPFYKKELRNDSATVIYTFWIFRSDGEKIFSTQLYQPVGMKDFHRGEGRNLQDHEKDVEGYKYLNSASLAKAMDQLIRQLSKDTKFTEQLANANLKDNSLFGEEIRILFEDRKQAYPDHYSALTLSTARRSGSTKGQVATRTSEEDVPALGDKDVSEGLGKALGEVVNYGLFIAVNDYRDLKVNDLTNPISDAKRLRSTLIDQYTFDQKNTFLMENPSREEIIKMLDFFAQKLKPTDNFLIFYAGHGIWDEKLKKGFWLPSDAEQDNRANWFSNSDLRDYIGGINSKHTLLVADACFSGGIFKTREAFGGLSKANYELYRAPSRKAMTSGALKTVPDQSVFIEYLVRRLAENKKAFISSEEIFASFKSAVVNNSPVGQIPQFGEIRETGDEGGDFIFIKRD